MQRFSSIFSQLLQLFPRLEFEQAVKKASFRLLRQGFHELGPVRRHALLPVRPRP